MNEASQRCDGLFGDVEVGGTVRLIIGAAQAVNFLVDLGTAMVTVLTSTGNAEHDLEEDCEL